MNMYSDNTVIGDNKIIIIIISPIIGDNMVKRVVTNSMPSPYVCRWRVQKNLKKCF